MLPRDVKIVLNKMVKYDTTDWSSGIVNKMLVKCRTHLTTVGNTSAEKTWAAAQPPAIPAFPSRAIPVITAACSSTFPKQHNPFLPYTLTAPSPSNHNK